MANVPDKPEEIFEEYTRDFETAFGNDLISIILYGSGARGGYIPKKSDINFLIILSQSGIQQLDRALEFIPKWRGANVAVPLCLTKRYIQTALDTFPIEFLDMKGGYKVVHGEDVLKDIMINDDDLRRQVERELRGKLVHLREGFLGLGQDRDSLADLLARSVPVFIPIFVAMLHLKNQKIPSSRPELFKQITSLFGLENWVFTQLLNVKSGEWRGSAAQLQTLTLSYINQVKRLVEAVDQM